MSKISMNPETFTPGGLPDDFDATLTFVRFMPRNYGNDESDWTLVAKVIYEPYEDSDQDQPITQYYSMGKLSNFVPTNDGTHPAGGSLADYQAIHNGEYDIDEDELEEFMGTGIMSTGSRSTYFNNTNWAHFCEVLASIGFDDWKEVDEDVSSMEGLKGHLGLIAQKQRKGLEGNKNRQILVFTELYDRDKGKSKGKAKGKSKSKSIDESVLAEGLRDHIEENGSLKKKDLASVVIQLFDNSSDQALAMQFVTDDDNLNNLEGLTLKGNVLKLE